MLFLRKKLLMGRILKLASYSENLLDGHLSNGIQMCGVKSILEIMPLSTKCLNNTSYMDQIRILSNLKRLSLCIKIKHFLVRSSFELYGPQENEIQRLIFIYKETFINELKTEK